MIDAALGSPVPFTDKDRKILYGLSLNSRIGLSELARHIGLSKQVISYRLKQLELRGVIQKYYAITNVYSLGKTHYRVFVKYRNMTSQVEAELRAYLVNHPQVSWVLLADGDFDVFFVVWADNIVRFEEVYDDVMGRFGNYFGEKYFSIATRIEYLPFRFLYKEGKPRRESFVFGDGMYNHKLDDLEKKILVALNHHGRIGYSELGAQFGISPQLAKKKIANLVERKIIIGFNVKIDHNLLGYTYQKVLLKLNHTSREELDAFSSYLRERAHVLYLLKTIGTYDFEFEVMTRTSEEFFTLIREMRQVFSENIKEYSVVTMSEEAKYEHLDL